MIKLACSLLGYLANNKDMLKVIMKNAKLVQELLLTNN